jgi:O-antigen/teichoic acid export membrane protein
VHPRKFVRDSLATAFSQYVARFALLARGVVAASALGPAGYGAWNALSLLLDYGAYASCGALAGLDLRLPAAASRGDRIGARRLMAGAWSVVALGAGVFVLGVILYLASGDRRIATPWGWGAPILMLAAAVFQLMIQYHAGSLRAHGEFRVVSEANGIQAVLGGGLGLALVSRFGVWGLLGGWLAGSLTALVWMRRGPVRPPLGIGAPGEGLALARLGFPIFAFFTASLVLRSVDRIAFVRYVGAEGLGHYSLGLMVAGLVLYLPEAAATVLYPRMSAAAHGARDPERTRAEVRQTHRALAVALPPAVALGMVWAAPVVAWLLPAFREGVGPLRILALGGLVLSGATLPGYFVLAGGPRMRLLAMATAVALLTGVLVFWVAAHDHDPVSIAIAAASGYAAFALGLVALAAPGLCASLAERARFVAASFVPALWAGGAALAACAVGGPESPGGALLRSLAVTVAYLPVLWWFGRGVGLRRLVHEWLAGRVAAA